jgi:hypothetical protein
MFNDLMENIEWFFNIHDKDKDGYLTKDEVLTLSETFLVSYFATFPLLYISGVLMLLFISSYSASK